MNCDLYRHMGAHPAEVNGVAGCKFHVWAPNAREVSVLLDSNGWTHGAHPLASSDSGVWWGFLPGVKVGDCYKFSIHAADGQLLQKADPYAFYAELPPKSASVVYDLSGYEWADADWLSRREDDNWHEQPLSIYEVHLGSWKRPQDGREYFNFRELAPLLVEYVKEMGYTHVELMPVMEHPFGGSWGYQATGYFATTSRWGTPHDFKYFVDLFHQNGIGVILDWVPAHFSTDGHSLGWFDGTCLYEHSDPRKGYHPDWGTLIFNYGRAEVRDFLLSSARFWVDEFHIDGLRCDAVSSMLYLDYSRKFGEWVPNAFGGRENLEAIQFLRDLNTMLYQDFPGIMSFAEESTAWGGVSRPVYLGGLGFGFKWDMGWMNDTLHYLSRDPIYRQYYQNELSFRNMYAYTENFVLPLSHDEVVHGKGSLIGKMPGDHWQQFGNLRLLFGYQYTTPGKKFLFMGGEFGQWKEWDHRHELDWALLGQHYHDGLRKYVRDLNHLYVAEPALYQQDAVPQGFSWINCDDRENSVYTYVRFAEDREDFLVIVVNATPVPRHDYRVGVPRPGFYKEILNSDSAIYGGSNVGNAGGTYTEVGQYHSHGQFISLSLPPLGVLVLKPITAAKR